MTLGKFDTMLRPASAVEKATGKMQWAELKVIFEVNVTLLCWELRLKTAF